MRNSSRYLLFLLLVLLCILKGFSQNDSLKTSGHSFEVQIFSNAGIKNRQDSGSIFDYSIKRTLLIYNQQISSKFSFCLAGDTYVKTDKKAYQLTPYLKRAYLQYHHKGLSVSAGLLVLEHFKYQREIWKLRYIDKTFQNKFKYGENRNIGVLLKHKLSKHFLYDFAVTTGYNTPFEKSTEEWAISSGQTLKTKFCNYRLFNSFGIHPSFNYVISLFVNKELGKGVLGFVIANKSVNKNKTDKNQFGFSVFGNYQLSKRIMAFARYDWNNQFEERKIENVLYAGLQYPFKKYFKASIYYKNNNSDQRFFGVGVFILCR